MTADLSRWITGLRHVGVVTDDARAMAQRLVELTGATVDHVAGGDSDFAFVHLPGGATLELVQPVTDRFRALLLRRGVGADHVCFTVSDIEAACRAMLDAGARFGHVTPEGILTTPRSRMAYFDAESTGGLLIELVQEAD